MTAAPPGSAAGPNRRWFLIARILGVAIVVLSVAYLGRALWENGLRLGSAGAIEVSAPWIAAGALLFACNHLANSTVWVVILRRLGQRLTGWQLIGIGLVAQIGKYAPGNIAHQVGRATLASQRGVSVKVVAWSAVLEIAGVALACLLISGVVALVAPESLRHIALLGALTSRLPIFGALLLIAVAGAALLTPLLIKRLLPRAAHVDVRTMLAVIFGYVVGYAFAGGSFYAVARALSVQDISLLPMIGVYAMAWFVGFVTPGAPGGLGVREAILVAMFPASVDPGLAFAVAVAHRLLTGVVDGFAFLLGAAMLSRSTEKAAG